MDNWHSFVNILVVTIFYATHYLNCFNPQTVITVTPSHLKLHFTIKYLLETELMKFKIAMRVNTVAELLFLGIFWQPLVGCG